MPSTDRSQSNGTPAIPDNPAPAPRRRKYRRTDRVAYQIQARHHSASPEAAHQHELRVRAAALDLMTDYRLAQSIDRGVRFLTDLEGALLEDVLDFDTGLIRAAQAKDSHEDVVEHAWLLSRTAADLVRLERAKVASIALERQALLAIRSRLRAMGVIG